MNLGIFAIILSARIGAISHSMERPLSVAVTPTPMNQIPANHTRMRAHTIRMRAHTDTRVALHICMRCHACTHGHSHMHLRVYAHSRTRTHTQFLQCPYTFMARRLRVVLITPQSPNVRDYVIGRYSHYCTKPLLLLRLVTYSKP